MQERIDRNARTARYSFDSLREVAQYIDGNKPTWPHKQSVGNRAERTWDLSLGYDGAVNLAREGWPEGAQRAQEALQAFNPMTPAPDTRVDFYGHMPHVPRYCAGAPDSMIRHHDRPMTGSGKIITLYVNVVANASQNAGPMSNYGLGIAQYVNQLESEGMRVELHAACAIAGKGWTMCHTWQVKSADQPLDLAVVAFAIGHPAMFRRLWFALCERSVMPPSPGYHHASEVRADHIINMPANAYILNGMMSANANAPTANAALAHIRNHIERAIEEAI